MLRHEIETGMQFSNRSALFVRWQNNAVLRYVSVESELEKHAEQNRYGVPVPNDI